MFAIITANSCVTNSTVFQNAAEQKEKEIDERITKKKNKMYPQTKRYDVFVFLFERCSIPNLLCCILKSLKLQCKQNYRYKVCVAYVYVSCNSSLPLLHNKMENENEIKTYSNDYNPSFSVTFQLSGQQNKQKHKKRLFKYSARL